MIKFYVQKQSGVYLGAFDDGGFSENHHPYGVDAIEVNAAPKDGRDIWNFNKNCWVAYNNWLESRVNEYPDIGDQLDAILKGFNQLRLNGTDLPADLDSVVSKWLAVKKKYPKPRE